MAWSGSTTWGRRNPSRAANCSNLTTLARLTRNEPGRHNEGWCKYRGYLKDAVSGRLNYLNQLLTSKSHFVKFNVQRSWVSFKTEQKRAPFWSKNPVKTWESKTTFFASWWAFPGGVAPTRRNHHNWKQNQQVSNIQITFISTEIKMIISKY